MNWALFIQWKRGGTGSLSVACMVLLLASGLVLYVSVRYVQALCRMVSL